MVIVIITTGFKKNLPTGDDDTTINIIGGLRDCSVIYKAIDSYFNETDTFQDLIANRNEFNLKTERSKNIAPLQKKKMIPYEVLNAGQLKKYLNADW